MRNSDKNEKLSRSEEFCFIDGEGKDITNIVLVQAGRLSKNFYYPFIPVSSLLEFSAFYPRELFTAYIDYPLSKHIRYCVFMNRNYYSGHKYLREQEKK